MPLQRYLLLLGQAIEGWVECSLLKRTFNRFDVVREVNHKVRNAMKNAMLVRLRSKCTNVYPAYAIAAVVLCVLLALSGAALSRPSAPSAGEEQACGMILDLNDSTVNESIARHSFFILDVYKPLCNPCERMKAAIDQLSTELGCQVVFGMIDGRNNQMTERRYNITSYPTLLIFDNGTLVDKMEGFASKKYIVDRLSLKKQELNTSMVST